MSGVGRRAALPFVAFRWFFYDSLYMTTPSVDFRLIALLSAEQAHTFRAIPFAETSDHLEVWGDAKTQHKKRALEMILGKSVMVKPEESASLDRWLLTYYPRQQNASSPTGQKSDLGTQSGADVVQFVQKVLTEAAQMRASDIHIERYEDQARIRFRWEGDLLEKYEVPADQYNAIISRIKIMAELDIAERRLPQDGRIHLKLSEQAIDIRVSTIPGKYGEKAVLRLLTRSQEHLQLDRLGF
ncbi:MAG: ATPase, T2SS/T4P/T4SS family, partial [Bacteroidota bacterium]